MVVFIVSSACRRTLLRRTEANVGSEERSLSDLVGRSGGNVAEASDVDRSIGAQGGSPWYEESQGRISICSRDSTFARMDGAEAWLVNERGVLWRVGSRMARMPERLPGFSSVRVFERCNDRVPMVFTISGLPSSGLLGTLREEGRCKRVPPELNCLSSGGKGRIWIIPCWTVRRSRWGTVLAPISLALCVPGGMAGGQCRFLAGGASSVLKFG